MIKGQKLVASDGYEVLLYPLESIRITQSYKGSTSHSSNQVSDTGLWDVTGVTGDNPKGYIYAPCTMIVKVIKTGYVNGNTVILQSKDKVHLPNGNLDFVCFGFAHDNVLDVKVGQEVVQGQHIGNCGSYGNVTGVHSHLMLRVGKWIYGNTIPTCWNKKGYKIFYLPNAVNIDKFFYKDNVRTIDTSNIDGVIKLDWKEHDDMDLNILKVDRDNTRHQVEIKEALINARSEHSTSSTKTKLGKLPVGIYNVYETYDDGTYKWFRVGSGVWVATLSSWTCYKDYPATDSSADKIKELETRITSLESKIKQAKEVLA